MMRISSVVHGMLALAALSVLFLRGADAATTCGYPGPNQAIVYDTLAGNCDVLAIGSYSATAVAALSVGNDKINYVWPGSNVKVTLYENDLPGGGPGDWMPVITPRSVVSDFERKTSAIRVEARTGCTNSPGFNQCVVWADAWFSGNCDVVDVGFPLTYPKILGLSVGNDTVSSVICGSGSTVLLWEHISYAGSSLFIGAGTSLPFVGWPFNDKTSSLVVQSSSATCTIPSSNQCGDNGYCEQQGAGCHETFGVCKLKPTSCSPNILPSCGCDGRSYANDCEREAGGVSLMHDGVCNDPSCPSMRPSQGTSCSPAGTRCVYSVPGSTCVQPVSCTNGVWSEAALICNF
jgi:hypothetical protein